MNKALYLQYSKKGNKICILIVERMVDYDCDWIN